MGSKESLCMWCGRFTEEKASDGLADCDRTDGSCGCGDERHVEGLVADQANDPGLWFVPQTASEAYLQQALRRLHAAIEGPTGRDTDNDF